MEYLKKYLFLILSGGLLCSGVGAETILVDENKVGYIGPLFNLSYLAQSSQTAVESKKTFNQDNTFNDNSSKNFRTGLLISSFALGTALYGAMNWWDDSSSQFQVRHEGWFNEDTPNGGADKLGHAYSFYLSTRLMRRGFEWAGYSRQKAAQWAGITSAALSVGVEIMDGFTEEYGFSPEDTMMNLGGIGLGVFLEMNPQWDDLFDVRLHYWTSDDARKFDDYDPVADYSGQTYLLILKASGVPALNQNKWLRYFELALGYGTRGYQPNDGTEQPTERNLYYGLSLNLSQLLNDFVFKNNNSRTQQVTEQVLEYWQMPGTALLVEDHL
ncbi:conserved hypothetical protein, secreted [Beggiatoa sp. PS]|nr:conserved hypothetical protein, secreted [Beggiatoa sp. PS]